MPIYLRQSTASQEIPLGYFVDSTDGNTEETALTIANTDIKIWKTGATTLASKNSGGATHISNGIYYAVLDATDSDTIGPLIIFVHVAGALSVRVECCVLDEAVYDVLFGTTALATVSNITGGTITAVTNLTNAPTNGDLTATMKASVNAEADTALADYDAPTHAELTAELATADDATLVAIAALPTATDNADALLKRDWTSVTGEASRSVLNALRAIRNKFSTTASPGSVTVYKEDDTTAAYTKTLTVDANAEHIVEG